MAKKVKLIHINDGTPEEKTNGNYHYVEEFTWTEDYLKPYLRKGYEVKHMVPMVAPAIQGEGGYNFYISGFTFYLEKEVSDEESRREEEAEREENHGFGFSDSDDLLDEEDYEYLRSLAEDADD